MDAMLEEERKAFVKRIFIFLGAIYFIQGISQGGISGLFYLPLSFMFKDKLGFDQQQLAYFRGLVLIPWAVKPLYGLLSDFIPFLGYRRKSWYVVVSSLGICCALYLTFFCDYSEMQLLIFLASLAVSFAFCDVLCDAVMVEHGKPLEMTDKFQSVQWASITTAAVLSGIGGGLIATYFPYKYVFLAMAVPSLAVLIIAIFFVPEKKYQYKQFKKSEATSVVRLNEAIWVLVVCGILVPVLLRINAAYFQMPELRFLMLISPFLILGSLCFLFRRALSKMVFFCLMFLFWWGFSLWLSDAPFFYYKTNTLGFSEMFMGKLQTIGSVGGVLGALLFLAISRRKLYWRNRFIAETSLSNMLKWSGFIGIMVILSSFFLMGVKSAILLGFGLSFIYQFSNLTMLVLAAEFCPNKIEATFFALLMSVINLGTSMSERMSGFLYKFIVNAAPQDFSVNFWAKTLVWIGWPTEHANPKTGYDLFTQYYAIGWLIVISLCAFSLYFFAIRFFGNSIKEKKELKIMDISKPREWLPKLPTPTLRKKVAEE
jgi:MFS family permease